MKKLFATLALAALSFAVHAQSGVVNPVFIQNATGAAGRPFLDKARDHWHVKDFKNSNGSPVRCNGAQDDTTGIQAAITARAVNGGDLHFSGNCRITATLSVPAATNLAIRLIGDDQRSTYLTFDANVGVGLRWGDATRDNSGTGDHVTYYGGIENMTLTANAAAATATLLRLVEPHFFTMRNVLVQKANGAGGTCIEMLGSVTATLDAAAWPHAWRNKFYNVWADDCRKPLVLENADENEFYSSNFGVTKGITASANTLNGIEIKQGHNNRFYGTLINGDTDPTYRGAYVGVKVDQPVVGRVQNNQFYGIVAEGFNRGIWIDGTPGVALPYGTVVYGYHSSINATSYYNVLAAGAGNPANQTLIHEVLGPDLYSAAPGPRSPMTTLTLSAGSNQPSVNTGNAYYFVGNGGGSTVNAFSLGKEGQVVWVRVDPNVTLIDASQSGGVDLYLWGRVNYAPFLNASEWIGFLRTEDRWVQLTPPIAQNAGGGTGYFGRGAVADFDSGYRVIIPGFYADNIAGTADTTLLLVPGSSNNGGAYIAPRPGSITGVSVHSNAARTAGSLTLFVYKNGSQYGAMTAVLDGTNTTFKASTTTQGNMTFVAGDAITLVAHTVSWTPTTADIRATLEITQ